MVKQQDIAALSFALPDSDPGMATRKFLDELHQARQTPGPKQDKDSSQFNAEFLVFTEFQESKTAAGATTGKPEKNSGPGDNVADSRKSGEDLRRGNMAILGANHLSVDLNKEMPEIATVLGQENRWQRYDIAGGDLRQLVLNQMGFDARMQLFRELALNSGNDRQARTAIRAMAQELHLDQSCPDYLTTLRNSLTCKALADFETARISKDKQLQADALARIASLEPYSRAARTVLDRLPAEEARTARTSAIKHESDLAKRTASVFQSFVTRDNFNPDRLRFNAPERDKAIRELEALSLERLERTGDWTLGKASRDFRTMDTIQRYFEAGNQEQKCQILKSLRALAPDVLQGIDTDSIQDNLIPEALSRNIESRLRHRLGSFVDDYRLESIVRTSLANWSGDTLAQCHDDLRKEADKNGNPNCREVLRWLEANAPLATICDRFNQPRAKDNVGGPSTANDTTDSADEKARQDLLKKQMDELVMKERFNPHAGAALKALMFHEGGQIGKPTPPGFEYLTNFSSELQAPILQTSSKVDHQIKKAAAEAITDLFEHNSFNRQDKVFLTFGQSSALGNMFIEATASKDQELSRALATCIDKTLIHAADEQAKIFTDGLVDSLRHKDSEPLANYVLKGERSVLAQNMTNLSDMAANQSVGAMSVLAALAAGAKDTKLDGEPVARADELAPAAGIALRTAAKPAGYDHVLEAMLRRYKDGGDNSCLLATMGSIASDSGHVSDAVRSTLRSAFAYQPQNSKEQLSAAEGMLAIAKYWNNDDVQAINDRLTPRLIEKLSVVAPDIPEDAGKQLLALQLESLKPGNNPERMVQAARIISALSIHARPEHVQELFNAVKEQRAKAFYDSKRTGDAAKGAEAQGEFQKAAQVAMLRMLGTRDEKTQKAAFDSLKSESCWSGGLFKDENFRQKIINYVSNDSADLKLEADGMKLIYTYGIRRKLAGVFQDLGVPGSDNDLKDMAGRARANYGEETVRTVLKNWAMLNSFSADVRAQLTGSRDMIPVTTVVYALEAATLNQKEGPGQLLFMNLDKWLEQQQDGLAISEREFRKQLTEKYQLRGSTLEALVRHTQPGIPLWRQSLEVIADASKFTSPLGFLADRTTGFDDAAYVYRNDFNREQRKLIDALRAIPKEDLLKIEEQMNQMASTRYSHMLAQGVGHHFKTIETNIKLGDLELLQLATTHSATLKERAPELYRQIPSALERLHNNHLAQTNSFVEPANTTAAVRMLHDLNNKSSKYCDYNFRLQTALHKVDSDPALHNPGKKGELSVQSRVDRIQADVEILTQCLIAGKEGSRGPALVEYTKELALEMRKNADLTYEQCQQLLDYQRQLREKFDAADCDPKAKEELKKRDEKVTKILELFEQANILSKAILEGDFYESTKLNWLLKDGLPMMAALAAAAATVTITGGAGLALVGLVIAPGVAIGAEEVTKEVSRASGLRETGSLYGDARRGTGSAIQFGADGKLRLIGTDKAWDQYKERYSRDLQICLITAGVGRGLSTVLSPVRTATVNAAKRVLGMEADKLAAQAAKVAPSVTPVATNKAVQVVTNVFARPAIDVGIQSVLGDSLQSLLKRPDAHEPQKDNQDESVLTKLYKGDRETWQAVLIGLFSVPHGNHVEPHLPRGTDLPIRVAPGHEPVRVSPGHEPVRVAPGHEPVRVAPGHEPVRVAPGHEPVRVGPGHEPVHVTAGKEPPVNKVAAPHGDSQHSSAPQNGTGSGEPKLSRLGYTDRVLERVSGIRQAAPGEPLLTPDEQHQARHLAKLVQCVELAQKGELDALVKKGTVTLYEDQVKQVKKIAKLLEKAHKGETVSRAQMLDFMDGNPKARMRMLAYAFSGGELPSGIFKHSFSTADGQRLSVMLELRTPMPEVVVNRMLSVLAEGGELPRKVEMSVAGVERGACCYKARRVEVFGVKTPGPAEMILMHEDGHILHQHKEAKSAKFVNDIDSVAERCLASPNLHQALARLGVKPEEIITRVREQPNFYGAPETLAETLHYLLTNGELFAEMCAIHHATKGQPHLTYAQRLRKSHWKTGREDSLRYEMLRHFEPLYDYLRDNVFEKKEARPNSAAGAKQSAEPPHARVDHPNDRANANPPDSHVHPIKTDAKALTPQRHISIGSVDAVVDLAKGPVAIGRKNENGIMLNAKNISGHHAEVGMDQGGIYLKNLSTHTNDPGLGTWVREGTSWRSLKPGERVYSHEVDEIYLGGDSNHGGQRLNGFTPRELGPKFNFAATNESTGGNAPVGHVAVNTVLYDGELIFTNYGARDYPGAPEAMYVVRFPDIRPSTVLALMLRGQPLPPSLIAETLFQCEDPVMHTLFEQRALEHNLYQIRKFLNAGGDPSLLPNIPPQYYGNAARNAKPSQPGANTP